MPPPPPPPLSPPFLLLTTTLIIVITSSPSISSAQPCSCRPSSSAAATTTTSPCPPFKSSTSLPYPFSSTPGCGHPSFQIKCSSPHSLISINNLSFSLLDFLPNSSSLHLSPHPTTANDPSCSAAAASQLPFLPPHSINLSGSPFRVPDGTCSRLALLRPCSAPSLPNCTLCPWHCSLVKNPSSLLHDCGSHRQHPAAAQIPCHVDVLGYLNMFLGAGFLIERVDDGDSYFANCKDCQSRNGSCGFNSSDPRKQFLCFGSEVRQSSGWVEPKRVDLLIAFCFVFFLFCLLCSAVIATLLFRDRRFMSSNGAAAVFLRRHGSAALLPPNFTYEELEHSTNRFDPSLKIGDGGFGSVYLGQLQDGRFVAVKQLHGGGGGGGGGGRALSAKSFCNEILILSSINHPNLVKLHGYCSDPRGLVLVYDYVPNGTLADHLHGPKSLLQGKGSSSLNWQLRIDIALQVAMAMEYLHFSVHPPIVHRDITTANIFVEKDMRVKLGDFGLSRLLRVDKGGSSSDCVWTGPQGTPGYLDPDYHRSFRLTEKSDVYSFGVVLLELLTGMKAVDQRRENREVGLVDLVVGRIQTGQLGEVVDPAIWDERVVAAVEESIGAVAEVAFRCVAAEKDDRPDAREVAAELRRILGSIRGQTQVDYE
ncbi:hypothetical protein Dimus_014986 [Dionaea muscipula]